MYVFSALATLLSSSAFAGDVTCDGDVFGAELIDGNVIVEGTCTLDGTTVDGNVIVELGANLLVLDAFVGGSIQTDGARRVRVKRSEVIGDIQLTGLTGALRSEVLHTAVGGTVDVHHNESELVVGRSDIDSDLKANDNEGGVTIAHNEVGGNLQCQGNVPAPTGFANTVDGVKEDQCAQL